MVINKEYFLNRLANGEDMDVIGEDIAAMMTEAMNEHNAKLEAERAKAEAAKAETEAEKHALVHEMVEIIQELAILEGLDPDDIQVTDEEIAQMVEALTGMFQLMVEVKKNLTQPVTAKVYKKPASATGKVSAITPQTDDEVLANFIKMFS